jgi:hypothetical protein
MSGWLAVLGVRGWLVAWDWVWKVAGLEMGGSWLGL